MLAFMTYRNYMYVLDEFSRRSRERQIPNKKAAQSRQDLITADGTRIEAAEIVSTISASFARES